MEEQRSSLTLILVFVLGFLFSKFLPEICNYVQNPTLNILNEGFRVGAPGCGGGGSGSSLREPGGNTR